MDNQHQHIKGYRDLSAEEIALMNECKELAEQCGKMVAKLRQHNRNEDGGIIAQGKDLDQRWISIGATELQQGWMAIIRGIAQPTTF